MKDIEKICMNRGEQLARIEEKIITLFQKAEKAERAYLKAKWYLFAGMVGVLMGTGATIYELLKKIGG